MSRPRLPRWIYLGAAALAAWGCGYAAGARLPWWVAILAMVASWLGFTAAEFADVRPARR